MYLKIQFPPQRKYIASTAHSQASHPDIKFAFGINSTPLSDNCKKIYRNITKLLYCHAVHMYVSPRICDEQLYREICSYVAE